MVDHKRKNVTSELKKKITSMESKNKKKKNNWRKEKIWLMYFQREEYWRGIGSRRGIGTQQRTPPYPTTAFSQRRKAWPRSFVPTSTSTA